MDRAPARPSVSAPDVPLLIFLYVPFAKPRFVADGDRLALLNVPLPSPRAILAARSIDDLPFVEYDRGYRTEDWTWHPLDRSYLYRFLASAYRGWSGPDGRGSDDRVVALNREILRAFIREVRADGSSPVVVYFPSRLDFRIRARKPGWQSLAQTMLHEARIPHTDLTAYLEGIDPAARFGPGHLGEAGVPLDSWSVAMGAGPVSEPSEGQ